MKATLAKLLACLLFNSAICFPGSQATAQTTSRPDQKGVRTPLVEALEKITQVFGTQFVYDPKPLEEKYTTVKMDDIKSKTVEDVLKSILYPNNFVFLYVKSNYYTIVTKDKVGESLRQQPPSNPPASTAAAPETKPVIISGTVTDAKNDQPLSGVSVLVNGTQSGGVTDPNGRFSITVHNVANPVLHISIVGYENTDVKTDGLTEMAIKLSPSTAALGEVVVVGYGTQKKGNLTGAVSVVNMDEVLGSRPVIRADEALEGVIPGLNISSNSGQPGHPGTTLNIRGYTSINGGSPLVLVDNVPMPIGDVNPADIQTVTVLKDAAAASIYGARAAFGVILISTKKGKKNKPLTFNYSANLTSTIASDLPVKSTPLEFVSALNDFGTKTAWVGQDVATWLTLLKEYETNPAAYPDGKKVINGVTYPLANSDVYGAFFRKGFEHLHNLSFGGGSEKSIYRISLGYTDQNGIMVTNKDRYRKYNLNTFLSTDLAKNLVASLNVFYKNDFLTTPGNFASVIGYAVDQSSYSPTGIGTIPTGEQYPYLMPNNILKYEPPQEQFGDDIRLFGKLEYAPVQGLKVTAEYTFNRTVDNERQTTLKNQYLSPDTYVLTFLNNETSYKRITANTNYRALNVYGNYTRNFGNHNIGLLAGTNREMSKYESFNVSRLSLISSQVPSVSTSSGTIGGDDDFAEYAIVGYFGRINYNYKEKYLLEANGRYDGSSRFAPGHQFGFFPSVSAGWQISNENFMAPFKRVVSNLKFRASYGEIGNQVIVTSGSQNYYPYIPGMNPFNVSWINGSTNLRYLSLSAPALVSAGFSWETVQTANVGVDLGLLRNKLTATFELYNRKTLNMLAPGLELPAVLGTSAPLQNVADLKSKGWELSVAWREAVKNFHYSLGFNVADNRAYITRFKNEAGLISNYYAGQEIGELWGYVTQGYFTVNDFEPGTLKPDLTGGVLKKGTAALEGMATKQNPGDIRYVDLNSDGIVNNGNGTLANPGDKKIIGNTNSRYLFGFTGSAEYKNFDFSFFVQGVGKRDIWINTDVYWPYRGQYGEVFKHQLDYWTPTHTDGFYPRMYPQGGGNTGNSELLQTKYLSNGAYLRMKNITLGYSVPKNLTRRVLLTNARLFFSGENLFTVDDLATGLNADNTNISSGGYYPFLKKYSFGLNVSF